MPAVRPEACTAECVHPKAACAIMPRAPHPSKRTLSNITITLTTNHAAGSARLRACEGNHQHLCRGIDAVGARKVDIGDGADLGSGAEGVESREEVGRRPRHCREAHLVRRAHVAHRLVAEARLLRRHARASLIPTSRWVSRAQHCLPAGGCTNTGQKFELQSREGQQAGALASPWGAWARRRCGGYRARSVLRRGACPRRTAPPAQPAMQRKRLSQHKRQAACGHALQTARGESGTGRQAEGSRQRCSRQASARHRAREGRLDRLASPAPAPPLTHLQLPSLASATRGRYVRMRGRLRVRLPRPHPASPVPLSSLLPPPCIPAKTV